VSWLQHHRRLAIFAVLVLAQAVFVVAIVVREEGRLDGLEIVLESRPVDPRDPLRGDFVILSYRAEEVDGIPALDHRVGETVFIELQDQGRYWVPITVNGRLLPRDEWRDGHAWLLARVESASPLRVSYPDLGAYFIPQGTGDPPEPPDVFVSVSDDGVARIKRLEIDGVRWPEDTVPQDRQRSPRARPVTDAEPPATPPAKAAP